MILSTYVQVSTMAAYQADVQINFCIFCPQNELKLSAKKKYCIICRNKKIPIKDQFAISKGTTPEDLERTHKKKMKYCYNCGEELTRDAGKIMCIDGCGYINIQEGKCYTYYAQAMHVPTSFCSLSVSTCI